VQRGSLYDLASAFLDLQAHSVETLFPYIVAVEIVLADLSLVALQSLRSVEIVLKNEMTLNLLQRPALGSKTSDLIVMSVQPAQKGRFAWLFVHRA
jgi:hypothetical protein